jgi:uncharacterized protein YeeX (DUF496 family)
MKRSELIQSKINNMRRYLRDNKVDHKLVTVLEQYSESIEILGNAIINAVLPYKDDLDSCIDLFIESHTNIIEEQGEEGVEDTIISISTKESEHEEGSEKEV